MNEKSLEKNLANLERELVNLQTAHEIGLGSVIFWEYSGNFTPPPTYSFNYILIKVKAGERLNPLLEFYVSTNIADAGIIKSNIYQDRYLGRAYLIESIPSAWKIVSTSLLEYSFTYNNSDAEAWIGEPL